MRKVTRKVRSIARFDLEAQEIRDRYEPSIDGDAEMDAFNRYVHAWIEHEEAWSAVRAWDDKLDDEGIPAGYIAALAARGVAQDGEFKSVSGDIRVVAAAAPARVTAYSVSGSLVVDDLSGELEATTVSGDMLLDLGTLTNVRLRSTSGDARLGGRLAKNARVEFESVSGDLSAKLAAEAGYSAEVDTFSGTLTNCFGVRSEPVSKYGPGERMSLARGEGGARIRAKTMSGDVRICDR